MCEYIGSACLIANAFASSTKKSFALVELRFMAEKVESALASKNVVIDWTRNSVLSAFECHPAMFMKHQNEVYRSDNSAKYFTDDFMNLEFNCGLNVDVVQLMQKTIHSYIDSISHADAAKA